MLTVSNIQNIIQKNEKRLAEINKPYNPFTGEGSPIPRFPVPSPIGEDTWYLPNQLLDNPIIEKYAELQSIPKVLESFKAPVNNQSVHEIADFIVKERLKEDFEFWSVLSNTIKDKDSNFVKMTLNRPQQRLHLLAETARLNNELFRCNLLKCRQYGGTTYIRSRFNWLQTARGNSLNSAIVADVKDQANHAIGMFNTFVEHFPSELGKITTHPYERSLNVFEIEETGSLLAVGSMQNPEALAGKTFQLLHASEIGKWQDTGKRKAATFMTNLNSTVPLRPGTEIWRETTAKGLNFFYREWDKSKKGKSRYLNIFVGTYQIEEYQTPIVNSDNHYQDYYNFIDKYIGSLDKDYRDYADFMWSLGATLENIKWYFEYKETNGLEWYQMFEEFPNIPEEAFQTSGRRCFKAKYIEQLRKGTDKSIGGVKEPLFVGDVRAEMPKREGAFDNLEFVSDRVKVDSNSCYNKLMVWEMPPEQLEATNRFLVTVDIGGTWVEKDVEKGSDFSVIAVFDRYWTMYGLPLRCVATWRGHIEVDLLAWKAAQIASIWHNALLCVERNYQKIKDKEGNHIQTILQELKDYYDNIYSDIPPDQVVEGVPVKYGFWTSAGSKEAMIDLFIAMLRDGLYLERYGRAVDEMDSFEKKENGTYGAMDGQKDDIVITRLLAAIVHERMEPCKPIIKKVQKPEYKPAGYGTAASI